MTPEPAIGSRFARIRWADPRWKRVAGSLQLLLLIVAIDLAARGIIFFRHHEKELVQRAENAVPGPLLDAPECSSISIE
jgi:hypothetical protein